MTLVYVSERFDLSIWNFRRNRPESEQPHDAGREHYFPICLARDATKYLHWKKGTLHLYAPIGPLPLFPVNGIKGFVSFHLQRSDHALFAFWSRLQRKP